MRTSLLLLALTGFCVPSFLVAQEDEIPTAASTKTPEVPEPVKAYFSAWKEAIQRNNATILENTRAFTKKLSEAANANSNRLTATRKSKIARVEGAIGEEKLLSGIANPRGPYIFLNAATKTKAIRLCTEEDKILEAIKKAQTDKQEWSGIAKQIESLRFTGEEMEELDSLLPGIPGSAGALPLKDTALLIDQYLKYRTSLETSYGQLLPEKLSVGSIGYFDQFRGVKVLQVIDNKNAIVQCVGPYNQAALWVSNCSTTGYADDANVKITSQMIVSGTKKYDTVSGGTRTVFVLEPFDIKPWLKYKDVLLR